MIRLLLRHLHRNSSPTDYRYPVLSRSRITSVRLAPVASPPYQLKAREEDAATLPTVGFLPTPAPLLRHYVGEKGKQIQLPLRYVPKIRSAYP